MGPPSSVNAGVGGTGRKSGGYVQGMLRLPHTTRGGDGSTPSTDCTGIWGQRGARDQHDVQPA